jgi:putative endonuclease
MTHIVYILKSRVDGSYFKGVTKDISQRLRRHNSGRHKTTKHKVPFDVVYMEIYETRFEAHKRKKFFNTQIGIKLLEHLLEK